MSTMKLINKPDHDPDNPYHYHDADGKKVAVTPEDWGKYKDDPTFREIRAAIEAEQAAYPQPEYSDEYNNYINNLAAEIENQRGYNGGTNNSLISESYGKQLPKGYSRTERGLIIGPDGKPLVASKFRNSPKYTADFNNPTLLTFNKGLGTERNINYYPINVNVPIYKQPLPVDRVMDVNDEYEKAIKAKMSERVPYTYAETKKDEPIFNFRFVYPYEFTNLRLDNISRGRSFLTGLNNALHKNQTDTLVYNNGINEVKVPISAEKLRTTGVNSVKNGVSGVLEGNGYSSSGYIKTKMVDRKGRPLKNKEYIKEVEKARANATYRRRDQEAEKNKPAPYILNKQYTLSELEDLVNKTYKHYDPSSYKDENMYYDDLAQDFMRSADLGGEDIDKRFDEDASSYKVNKGNSYSTTVTKYRNRTRKEAEKEAIIHINPWERVNTFATGGKLKLISRNI